MEHDLNVGRGAILGECVAERIVLAEVSNEARCSDLTSHVQRV